MVKLRAASIAAALCLLACGAAPPAPAAELSPSTLKFRLLDAVGDVAFCDPDMHPLARVLSDQYIDQQLAQIKSDREAFDAILRHDRIDANTLTTPEKRLVYADYKRLRALALNTDGDGYRFDYLAYPTGAPRTNLPARVQGTISKPGDINVTSRGQAQRLNCPICLSEDARIATPRGEVNVTDIHVGSVVWTLDSAGHRIPAPVLKVGQVRTGAGQSILRIVLEDRRRIDASSGHPLADGRYAGQLHQGEPLDGSTVAGVTVIPYHGAATHDLLPAGGTGDYWADGILLASTLR